MSPAHRLCCLLIAISAALALAGPRVGADVLHSPQGYTVTIPHGWQTRHEVVPFRGGIGTDMMYTHPPKSFPLFRIEVDPQRQATMQNAEAMQAAFLQAKVPGFHLAAQRLRRVAGSPASETAAGGMFEDQQVMMDMIYTIHAGRIYTISLMTTPKTVKADLKTFEHILGTLRWT